MQSKPVLPAIIFLVVMAGVCVTDNPGFAAIRHVGNESAGGASAQEAPTAGDPHPGDVIGSGDGRIHVIPSLSAPSVKNGNRVTIQAVVKALDGVAKVEARIERDVGPISKSDIAEGPICE